MTYEETRYATEEEFNAEVEKIYAEKLAELEEETVEAIAQIYAEAEKESEAQRNEWQAKLDALKAEGSGLKAEREAFLAQQKAEKDAYKRREFIHDRMMLAGFSRDSADYFMENVQHALRNKWKMGEEPTPAIKYNVDRTISNLKSMIDPKKVKDPNASSKPFTKYLY